MLAGRVRLSGHDPAGAKAYGGAEWGLSLVTVPPGYPGACRTTRLKQASMRGWWAGGRRKTSYSPGESAGHPKGRAGGLGVHAAQGGGGSVTRSGGARGPIQPLLPPTSAKNKHLPLAHPQKHPLVPRCTLGSGATCRLGTRVGAGCGRGGSHRRRLPTLGFHDVRSSVWKGLAGHREEDRQWQWLGGNLQGTRGGSGEG